MPLDRWFTVIILGGGALMQVSLAIDSWVHRRADGEKSALERLGRIEQAIEKMVNSAMAELERSHTFDVRLARVEERVLKIHGKEHD
jgi:hypothetical protein